MTSPPPPSPLPHHQRPMPAYAGPHVVGERDGYNSQDPALLPWHKQPVIRGFGRFLGPFGWMIFAAVLLFGCGACVPTFILGWWFPLVLLMAFAGVRAMSFVRAYRGNTVLAYVYQAVRLNLPLYEYLWAAVGSEGYFIRRRLIPLCRAIGAGASVGDALANHVPEIPDRTVASIRVGEAAGQLPAALHRAMAPSRKPADHGSDISALFSRIYPIWTFVFVFSIVTFLMIFVIPKFREIFKDFRVNLPRVTESLLEWSDWFANDMGWLVVGVPLVGGLLLYTGHHFRVALWGRVERFWPRHWVDPVVWRIPLVGRIAESESFAEATAAIADSVDAGNPLLTAVQHASGLGINAVLQDRLARWAANLNAGMPMAHAAAAAKLPPILVDLLRSAEATGEVHSVMDFLHRYYTARFSRARIALAAVAKPAMVILVGLLVGWVCVALFKPISVIVNGLADQIDPPTLQ